MNKLEGCVEVELPLVSIIITAHNYGRFLNAAIASVLAQTYREIECIVIDDASSDDTGQILAAAIAKSASVSAIANPHCLGQGATCRVGLRASRGQYIVFMDADDLLDPDFVRDHVYVHLSSRVHVGFTSSDIYQFVNGRLVVATGEAMNNYILGSPAPARAPFRPLPAAPHGYWRYDGPDPRILDNVYEAPATQTAWCWAPTTGNMFRRDALTLIADCDAFDEMRIGADAYLCVGVNVFCGSLLIDKALSSYRIHGANSGTYQAQLKGVRAVHADSELSKRAKELLIRHLTHDAAAVCSRLWHPETLLLALDRLDADLDGGGAQSFLSQCLERCEPALSSAVGEALFTRWAAGRAAASPRKAWLPNLLRGAT